MSEPEAREVCVHTADGDVLSDCEVLSDCGVQFPQDSASTPRARAKEGVCLGCNERGTLEPVTRGRRYDRPTHGRCFTCGAVQELAR